MFVDDRTVRSAREADLHAFLSANHPDLFRREGRSLVMKSNRSLSIKEGFHGYRDFATGETGNSITFLMRHLGYGFQDAVLALAGACLSHEGHGRESVPPPDPGQTAVELPPASGRARQMYAFLAARGIPGNLVRAFAAAGLLYQSSWMNNIVFVNRERDYCEIRGTYTFAPEPFHGCRKTAPDRFWYFSGSRTCRPETAYVTEAAIDAVSLWLLHRKSGRDVSRNLYASIGGVSNYAAIDRITASMHTVLAVDNDLPGEACRKRYKHLDNIIPVHKDWNEDLVLLPENHD